jgi:hypothetical protein
MSNIFEIIYNQAGNLRYTYATANSIGEAENKCGITKDQIKSIDRLKNVQQGKDNIESKPRKKIYYRVRKMDELERFLLPPDIQSWIMRYDAGSEQALVKQVPLTEDNISMIDRLADLLPLTRRYRGPRHNSNNMHRDCPKKDAERVSVYLRERVA